MVDLTQEFNPFEAEEADLRGLVELEVRGLSLSGLMHVSGETGVPFRAMIDYKNGDDTLEKKYLPNLYSHFFRDKDSEDAIKEARGENAKRENNLR